MTREKLSKQELSKKNAVGISVNPIYAYAEHWNWTGEQRHCCEGNQVVECLSGGSDFCPPGEEVCSPV